jgi:aspartate-semialdehyde dehydrogenase
MGLRVGFVGWRGMVGSVLLERMLACDDFDGLEPLFFSTSAVGGIAPNVGVSVPALADAHDLEILQKQQVIVTCQGGDYTQKIYDALRTAGWTGYWIDAASTLRMREEAVLVLDPVNRDVIDAGLQRGLKTFVGANCTVSLMLMGMQGLFRAGLVEWLSSMTYQSASGAGAKNMQELTAQMGYLGRSTEALLNNPAATALDIDKQVSLAQKAADFPVDHFGVPLAASLIPWIDKAVEMGQTREEAKGFAETNKILQTPDPIPVDGQCVRVGSMRCHSQALMIKLTRDVPLADVTALLAGANDWVRIVPNIKEDTLASLTPAAVSGSLMVPVGRLRKMRMGPQYLTAFTVGDQLLWGAAEPLRRMLEILKTR